jgi:threonine synthase
MRLISTRNPGLEVTFAQAVERNLPGDGGLFVPAELTPWTDVPALLASSWLERSTEVLDRLLVGELTRRELARIVHTVFDFPLPLVALDERSFALELFHGPSLAFKDFGARFLAAVLDRIDSRTSAAAAEGSARTPDAGARRPRTILTATSGDTGAAVAAAFWRRPGVRVAVLYPAGRVSPLQERQLACLGNNVRAFAVEGSFDDCQRLAKGCFADSALAAELALTSANSINIARLVAQVLYYFEAMAQLDRQRPGCRPVVAVPSGNFGNLCAGLYAQALGLPVRAFVAATNANRTVPDFLAGGPYRPRPSLATLSNAMDVGDPSNWERIEHLLAPAGAGEETRRQSLRSALRWGSLDDGATAGVLRDLWARGYQVDPHGAVAYGVLQRVLAPGETGIFLVTAHPAKFQSTLSRLGMEPALPPSLQALLDRPLRRELIADDETLLKARLRDRVWEMS